MRLPRVRFTVRLIMALVLVSAAACWGLVRWQRTSPLYPVPYYVGDLIRDAAEDRYADAGPKILLNPDSAALERLAGWLQGSVTPGEWRGNGLIAMFAVGKTTASVDLFPPTHTLIIRHSGWGHHKVAEWLQSQRTKIQRRKP